MPRVLLLAGRRKSGKDTTAAILSRVYGAHVDSFADGFKAFASKAFQIQPAWVWGPSDLREQKIPGLDSFHSHEWEQAWNYVTGEAGFEWLVELLGDVDPGLSALEYGRRASTAHYHLRLWLSRLRLEADRNKGLTVRHLLQQLGTEFGRTVICPDVWLVAGVRRALRVARGGGHALAVIVDGRFANEVSGVHREGGAVVHLIDPNAPPPSPDEHVSERDLDNVPPELFHATIYNDKARGVDALAREVVGVVDLLFPEVRKKS